MLIRRSVLTVPDKLVVPATKRALDGTIAFNPIRLLHSGAHAQAAFVPYTPVQHLER